VAVPSPGVIVTTIAIARNSGTCSRASGVPPRRGNVHGDRRRDRVRAARVAHAFANRTDGPTRFLLILSPPGHDRYFDELAEILAVEGPPDSDAIAELRRRYDTEQISSLSAGRT
jgi:hypothetical protein